MILENNRINWIDMARGYGILLVIFGHYSSNAQIKSIIYSFHMPLFFFLSGCVFKSTPPRSFSSFIKHKLRTMVIPYFVFGLMILPGYMLSVYSTINASDVFHELLILIVQRRSHVLWFLACLFIVEILFWILHNSLSEKQCAVTVGIMTLVGFLYSELVGFYLPWNIDIAFIAMNFFYAGYLFRHIGIENKIDIWLDAPWKKIAVFILMTSTDLLFCYLNISVGGVPTNMCGGTYNFIPFFLITAYSGIIAVVLFSKLFTLKCLCYVGSNSLIYYSLHSQTAFPLAELILGWCGLNWNTEWGPVLKFLTFGIYFVLVFAILTLINLLFTKTKLKTVLGKKI